MRLGRVGVVMDFPNDRANRVWSHVGVCRHPLRGVPRSDVTAYGRLRANGRKGEEGSEKRVELLFEDFYPYAQNALGDHSKPCKLLKVSPIYFRAPRLRRGS